MKPPRQNIPPEQVIEWLKEHHAALVQTVERDRQWQWLAGVNLSGEQNKPVRESIKAFGFRFAKRGHTLPSGQIAYWGHACQTPIPFRRKPKGSPNPKSQQQNEPASENDSATTEGVDTIDPELAAFLQS